jgi:SAM-dependent methyltransferase
MRNSKWAKRIGFSGGENGMRAHLQTWANYQRFAEDRGWLVARAFEHFMPLAGKKVLDFGCGVGGTAQHLAQRGAIVTAVDLHPEQAIFLKHPGIRLADATQEDCYFLPQAYDAVVLQDVLEHLTQPARIMEQVRQSLAPTGIVFISTPNRYSVVNLISDPHWHLPLVAMLPRPLVKLVVQKICRRDPRQREDWPALLSLRQLSQLLVRQGFCWQMVNQLAMEVLFQRPQAIVCRPLHLRLVNWVRRHRWQAWGQRLVNDHQGVFNFLINPTWYIIGQRA